MVDSRTTCFIGDVPALLVRANAGRTADMASPAAADCGGGRRVAQVTALQENKPIFIMTASFHREEPGPLSSRGGGAHSARIQCTNLHASSLCTPAHVRMRHCAACAERCLPNGGSTTVKGSERR